MNDKLSARERIEAHRVCREAEDLAERVPWAAWALRPFARLVRRIDAEIHRPTDLDDWQ